MAILPIIVAPDRRLRAPSEPVRMVADETRKLMDDMYETMIAAPGLGLSAIQVGIDKRVVVVRAPEDDKEKEPKTLYLANPVITWESQQHVICEEGCLSIPEQYVDLERPAEVGVRFLNQENTEQEIKVSGLLARCLQHELDHLEGILLIDRVSSVKRNMILRKLNKMKKLEQMKQRSV